MSTIKNRYEFLMLFDVENGNPNGDPDAGNTPRVDAETGYGIVTDVCLKRKIRNYVEIAKEGVPRFNILIKNDKLLNTKFKEAYDANGYTAKDKSNKITVEDCRKYMCKNYYDIRTFGAVMSTGENPCGIVTGPVQINFAKSIDTIVPQEISITRCAITNEKDSSQNNTMGKKSLIPYGLYRAEGYISALRGIKLSDDEDGQLSEEDVELLWDAIINMFENDRSAARGKMCMRKLYIFKHSTVLGNAPAHILFDKIKVEKKPNIGFSRHFDDYIITIDNEMPEGVELIEKL